GTAAALVLLTALRSADVTASWLARRRSPAGRMATAACAIAFTPVSVLRSLLYVLVTLPLALLFAAAAAAITLLATPAPAWAGGFAAGALVACYGLGPGSARSRRPLSKFFGAVTGTTPSTIVAFIGMTALAVAAVAAAISLPPYVWPVFHLTSHLANLPPVRDLTGLPRVFAHWRSVLHLVTGRLG
ncbi:MAG: hypothetical protein ACRDNZ_03010, partial [Streptosporangiaceae bacterium]